MRNDDEPRERRRGIREDFGREAGRKAERKLRARREGDRGVWFGLGMFGLVGWSVAIPTLLGLGLGLWLDDTFPGGPSWTITGLLVGIATGCVNAWVWVRRESGGEP